MNHFLKEYLMQIGALEIALENAPEALARQFRAMIEEQIVYADECIEEEDLQKSYDEALTRSSGIAGKKRSKRAVIASLSEAEAESYLCDIGALIVYGRLFWEAEFK